MEYYSICHGQTGFVYWQLFVNPDYNEIMFFFTHLQKNKGEKHLLLSGNKHWFNAFLKLVRGHLEWFWRLIKTRFVIFVFWVKIQGLTPINSIFTVWRINRGQPLKIGQKLKNRQLTAKTWLEVTKMLFIRVYKLVQYRVERFSSKFGLNRQF